MRLNRNVLKKIGEIFLFGVFAIALAVASSLAEKEMAKKTDTTAKEGASAADAEKNKALKNPYANDFGSSTIDVSKYPLPYQEGYKLLQVKCSKCHAASRPLNSQFVEPMGKNTVERKSKVSALQKSDPDIFKDKLVWQVEGDIWQRYVKRMMAKPGCEISKEEGKKIWDFLVYDSSTRKLGANKANWEKQRRALLEDFKKNHPARYKELYETTSAK